VALTLTAAALFLVSGITRVVTAFSEPEGRWLLVLSGGVSIILGLIVLFNVVEASLVLLGVLIAVQTLVEGVTLMVTGRLHALPTPGAGTAAPTTP
jgi:uncharacterized membrane protein HdeD (DUF308 family)